MTLKIGDRVARLQQWMDGYEEFGSSSKMWVVYRLHPTLNELDVQDPNTGEVLYGYSPSRFAKVNTVHYKNKDKRICLK